eukprot:5252110-Pleurochrysis_carterae.AAC.1
MLINGVGRCALALWRDGGSLVVDWLRSYAPAQRSADSLVVKNVPQPNWKQNGSELCSCK